jgi:uncharacterized protein (TIGR00255 family)
MTGFGEAERDTPSGRLRLEVKTVNHRFFNVNVKMPSGFDRLERDVVEGLHRHIARGHVSAHLSLDRRTADSPPGPVADIGKARLYKAALEAIQHELAIPGAVELPMLARFTDLLRPPEPESSPTFDVALLREMAEEAARGVVSLREAEGERLRADLEDRLSAMASELERVEERAPERLVRERDRLRQVVVELSEQVDVDEERLAREIAYLAEKWDISEELVRFRSHLELFAEALAGDGAEPVGKRLGFLIQEMHREANTIGSKASDVVISEASMALKEEIERAREQVENVE